MPPSKQKPIRKLSKDKFYHSKRGTYDNYRMNDTKQSRHVQRRVNKDTQKKVMLNSDFESRTDSDNEDDINQLDSSGEVSSQSSSDQAECIKGNCNCRPKTINVISQDQEFILDTLRKVEDEKTKQNLYEVFKKSVVKVEAKKTVNPYNLNDILNRFDQQSPKEVNIKELHEEVKQHKKEIKELRQFISLGLSDLQDQINRIGNQGNLMDIPESSHVNDNETDTFLNTVRAAENCIQEGLVPIPLCEETSQSLFGANGKRLAIKYKLTEAHIRNHDVCIKQTFILVKDLKEKALLGIPFLSTIYPMWIDNQGIRAKLMDEEILFEFANPTILLNQLRQPNIQLSQGLRPLSRQLRPLKISRKSLKKEAQVSSQENSYAESDDSTSYLPRQCKHVSTQYKAACQMSSQPKKVVSGISVAVCLGARALPVEPLLAVDRRLLGCKRVGVTSHKVSNQEIYKKGTFKFFTDYTIKTSEMTVSLEQDDQVIRLLDNRSVEKHKKDGYNFIHFGMIQVAAKPLTRLGLNTAIVMCLRDNRHLEYRDSIIGAVQAGLNDGPVYFQCYPNFTVRLRDADILDSVVLHIKTHGFKIKPGNSPVSIITRFAYKSMNTSVDPGLFAPVLKHSVLKVLNKLFNIQMEEENWSSPNLSDIPAALEFLFMNPLELQALPSQLEPLGKKRIQLRKP
ncbi:hypothetical protein CK203_109384 [Vitis vinifera]|uniref:Uncharacterized protein n=1 Tax=Vitis vinifera TaxID=29760 RepID=A0A438C414_VITVI|nr:hypothetical protein CK203_109384 [Vitis vinifera]